MEYEYQVDVGGEMYGMEQLQAIHIMHPLFDELSVGNVCSAELTMSFWPTQPPPRAAKIIPYIRAAETEKQKRLGEFWLDERKWKDSLLEVVAYDVLMKTEAEFPTALFPREYPASPKNVAIFIAQLIGTTLDERTVLNETYNISLSSGSGFTMRYYLSQIAAFHLGNWIATAEGKLLLVPLFDSMPPETHYLIEEQEGSAITFGGTRILV